MGLVLAGAAAGAAAAADADPEVVLAPGSASDSGMDLDFKSESMLVHESGSVTGCAPASEAAGSEGDESLDEFPMGVEGYEKALQCVSRN